MIFVKVHNWFLQEKTVFYDCFKSYIFWYSKQTRKFILIFTIYLYFLKTFAIFWVFSAVGVRECPPGFDNKLLRSF